MGPIKVTVRNGRIELQAPADWTDGTEVVVAPVAKEGMAEDALESSEAITEWLSWYEPLEPVLFTAEEREAWMAARREQKEREKAEFAQRAEKLQRMWQ